MGWLPGVCAFCAALSWLLCRPPAVIAQQPVALPQSLLLGDITCGDIATDCAHPNIAALHPYLHVVVNDREGNDDWQVQAGPSCAEGLVTILGGQPVPAGGYLEVVLDGRVATGGTALYGQSNCYVFRGRNHRAVTFYAAYFDDNRAPDADLWYPGYRQLAGHPDLPDLDVQYIHRAPSYDYDARPNGPAPGQPVAFHAHLANAGSRSLRPFRYSWLLDGHEVAAGVEHASLAPGQEAGLTLSWKWHDGRHRVELRTFPRGPEVSESNNSLMIQTDALTLGFWIEKSAYAYFQANQWRYCRRLPCATSNSFADWLERQVAAWNRLLRNATYPGLTPEGVIDRVRVDKIVLVPDGSLPLHGYHATNSPDMTDHSVDLEWGLPAAGIDNVYGHLREGRFDVDWSLVHELGHARSLADLYRFDVPQRDGPSIRVTTADGRLAYDANNPSDPNAKIQPFTAGDQETFLYRNSQGDIMSCTCTRFYGAYSALVLNRIQDRRPRCGNYNAPCNLGDWYGDIPPVNRLRILDHGGSAVPEGTEVRLFHDQGVTYSDHAFDNTHSTLLRTRRGQVTLPADPFQSRGSMWQAGHNLLLLEVRTPSTDEFCFEEPTDLNFAYWTGYRDASQAATYTMRLGNERLNGCNLRLPAPRVNEPFGASRLTSSLRAVGFASYNRRTMRAYQIRLLDGSACPRPMLNRRVDLLDEHGKQVASGMSDRQGRLILWVSAGIAVRSAVDVTDNHLRLTLRAAAQSPAPDPQPSRPGSATGDTPRSACANPGE